MFKTILVPTDGSDSAKHAFLTALTLAKPLKSRIILMHVMFTPEALGYKLSSGTTVPQEEISIYGKESLTATLAQVDVGSIPIEQKLKPGHPAAAIIHEIENENYDLVVMGSRGYGPVMGSLLGSVSQRVLMKASCPVLIVKTKEDAQV
ncbi:universal stress protein UspA-like protein [Desulfosporosinus orientis DSM 765]|uniref:Universal stress protein UspA-like protein n=1 Tax=Desulfosporosinus orientis (strain ATCC 19365 / DSM 765 / NCIMB 8382 / VKM B-1628 / Singapore I) TaxID=768706 RepID=G7W7V7_DESOD|nr:universal stress protein [Desulfosporosinus orientis]AET66383.1 universal stress protein UspA-like protein [Desulfosporosinus orientis DSM 765]